MYRLIMKAADRTELAYIGSHDPDRWSDVGMNGTFITIDGSGIQMIYQANFRDRGHGTRLGVNGANNYKIELPNDHPWNGETATIINYNNSPSQVLGSAIWEEAGLPTPEQQPIQVRVNGVNYAAAGNLMDGAYASKEQYNSDFTNRAFPDDPNGDMYIIHYTDYPYTTATSPGGNLAYRGTNPDAYRMNYFKETNGGQDDWSDLINLTYVLNDATITDDNFVAAISRYVNVDEWLRYIAIDTLLGNQEGGLCTGQGDDYGMYRGVADPRFQLVQWDMDTLTSIWGGFAPTRNIFAGYSSIPGFSRLLSNPYTVGLYYAQLEDLCNTVFAAQNFNPMADQLLGGWVPATGSNSIASVKTYVAQPRRQCTLPDPHDCVYHHQPAGDAGWLSLHDLDQHVSERHGRSGQHAVGDGERATGDVE